MVPTPAVRPVSKETQSGAKETKYTGEKEGEIPPAEVAHGLAFFAHRRLLARAALCLGARALGRCHKF